MPGIVLGTVLLALAYATAFFPPIAAAGPWLMLLGIVLLICSLGLLGTRRPGRRRPLLLCLAFAFIALILVGGFGAALLLPDDSGGLWLGLPRRAALLIYGIGVLPAVVVPLLYGWSFTGAVLTDQELQEFRSGVAGRSEGSPPE